jgi:arylsulfatase A-like enzyme
MKPTHALFVALGLACAALSAQLRAAEPVKPNILLLVADDLGWGDVGWHGSKFKTPNLDRLVAQGVELDRHYVQPVCSPTRTALLSGRWTGRFGPQALSPTNRRVFPLGTTTIASALKECGYITHLAGKWHLGSRMEWGPNHYGFDHTYGSLTGAADPWTHKYRHGPYEDTWHRDLQFIQEEGNATELIAREVRGWIKDAAKPWFIYVPFTAVHIPIDAPDEFKQLYRDAQFDPDPKRNESLQRYAAYITQMDARIGEFIAALDASGQRGNTLIVFTSDNGGLEKGGNAYVGNVPPTPALSSNLPLRGQKNELHEGGIRVPAFVNWPGHLSPRKVTAPLHAADWTPTLTKLVGWKPAVDPKFDGLDIWPLLTGSVAQPEPRSIYIPHPGGQALLDGDWKLIVHAGKNASRATELYHITEDPYEEHDLSAQEPARVQQLQAKLAEIRRDDLTEIPEDLKDVPN